MKILMMNLQVKNHKKLEFLFILIFNILFFCLAAHFLPIYWGVNDDVVMCMIASGILPGIPQARLIFINYIYGLLLNFFYHTFHGIEWYTVSFSVIHIISLSIVVYVFINTKKIKLLKFVNIFLLYILELSLIQGIKFTTTAAIAGFAGTLLLFEDKKVYGIFGIILFLISTLIRFEAAMLVMLLMLPIFAYKILPDIRKNFKLISFVTICICSAFILQIINNQAYKDEEWSYYMEYNKIRGGINDNPNATKINFDLLPEGISELDYTMLLNAFADGNYMDLVKMKEIYSVIQEVPLNQKIKNIVPSLNQYRLILIALTVLFIICFYYQKNFKKGKIFIGLYFLFYIFILSLISLNATLKDHVFITALYPVLFFINNNLSLNCRARKKLYEVYADIISRKVSVILLLFIIYMYLNGISQGLLKIKYVRESLCNQQLEIIEKIRYKNYTVIFFGQDLIVEIICEPFVASNFFNGLTITGAGWLTNCPYNKPYIDSYLSLLKKDTYLFIASGNKYFLPWIKELIQNNYNINTEVRIVFSTNNYLLVKFEEKDDENPI
jgi:hypothetical protein